MLGKTALYKSQLTLNAKMVEFYGWEMPLHYGSQIKEHLAVRESVGVFDVSHMTIVDVLGPGSRQFLRKLLTNDIDKLHHTGRAMYSCMCNEHGGIIDDLIVYLRASDNYRLVLNASTRDNVLPWLRDKIQGFKAGLQERVDLSMLAIQGPETLKKILPLLTAAESDAVSTLTNFECVETKDSFFARTGYTGEDGLEIIIPECDASQLWDKIINAGIIPCGLGARDTLRLEAGLLLYGQDMDETTTPFESGLSWTVDFKAQERDFIGRLALLAQQEEGINRKLVGLMLLDPGVLRHGQEIDCKYQSHFQILSGSYAPTLGKSIALARLPVGVSQKVLVKVRDKWLQAKVGSPRFVKQGKIIPNWL